MSVLGGIDCAIYATAALLLIAFGVALIAHALPSRSPSSDSGTGLIVVGIGLLCALIPFFRVWQVARALREGDAEMAEVTQAEVPYQAPSVTKYPGS